MKYSQAEYIAVLRYLGFNHMTSLDRPAMDLVMGTFLAHKIVLSMRLNALKKAIIKEVRSWFE